jgi:thioesterase domain-containing protein
MTAEELQVFLHERIPLSASMGVAVRSATPDTVVLSAPLAPNVNHRDTVFGGSASALAILAAWSVLHVRMQAEGLGGGIVIRRNTMSYERPITGDFAAVSAAPAAADLARLRAILARGRTARVHVRARLVCNGETVGELDGEFAVLPPGELDARPSLNP